MEVKFTAHWANYYITWWSSCFNKLDSDSTQISNEESWGSILPQSLDTTAIAECKVSLWTRCPLSRMNVKTQFNPPASNTAPDSRVQINSNTYDKKKFNLNEVHTKSQLFISIVRYLYPSTELVKKMKQQEKVKNPSLPQHPEGAKASSTLVVSSYSFFQKYGSQ